MNMFQRINITASVAVLGAAGIASYHAISAIPVDGSLFEAAKTHINSLLLTAFVLFFKIKTMLDDHQHFSEEKDERGHPHFSQSMGVDSSTPKPTPGRPLQFFSLLNTDRTQSSDGTSRGKAEGKKHET